MKWRMFSLGFVSLSLKVLGLYQTVRDVFEKKRKRDSKDFKIPKTIKLACPVTTVGVKHYLGPESLNNDTTKPSDQSKSHDIN